MKFSYTKLESFNEQRKEQRKYLKFYLGALFYVIIFVLFNVVGTSRSLNEEYGSLRNGAGKGKTENFAVWTYPVSPPKDELDSDIDEKLYCSYSPCAPNSELLDFYPQPYILNLSEIISQGKNLDSFHNFVKHHVWYKILHGANFPHHVQSVAIIAIISAHPNACVRTLGEDRTDAVCTADVRRFAGYDPTNANSVPPFAVQFMNMGGSYGILDYTSRNENNKETNLGNEMQSLAGLQFLPYLTDLVDIKTGLSEFEGNLLMNAWWGDDSTFPPNENAHITMTSLHLDDSIWHTARDNLKFFQKYNVDTGPIGAADARTYSFLQSLGISTYHSSGFISMMSFISDQEQQMKKKKKGTEQNSVLIVDFDEDVFPGLIPPDILDRVTHVKTRVPFENSRAHFKQAFEVIAEVAKADVVICFDIQVAFLAMANGAKTILVGDVNAMEYSAHGNAHLCHRQLPTNKWHFDVDNIGENPGVHTFDRYRASFLQHLKARSPLYYDAANLFGMLPLKRIGEGDIVPQEEYESHNHFQFVITTEPNTITWNVMRTIEAVFYFHPNAKVTIHSNSLPVGDENLDIFSEAGYDFEIKPYSFEELFKTASFLLNEEKELFLDNLPTQMKQQNWYAHEADLVKLLILERDGGVMMDIHVHLVKPLPKSFVNTAAWRDEKNEKIGTGILIFDKHNSFLREMIKDAIDISNHHYNRDWFHVFGQDLFSEHFLMQTKGTKDIKVMTHELFYPFEKEEECFTMNKEVHKPIDDKFTFAVHMKPEAEMEAPMHGSLCEELLMQHCIFCGEMVVPTTVQ